MRILSPVRSRRQLLVLPSLVLLISLASCGGGGDPSTTAPDVVPVITLSSSVVTLQGVGTGGSLTATVTPSNATVAWSSSRPDLVSVAGSGTSAQLSAVASGSAQITAQVTVGSRRAEAHANVDVVPIVRTIKIDSTNATLLLGLTRVLRARVGADAGADTTVRWTSSAPSVATVVGTGLVTAVSSGTVTISVASTLAPSISATLLMNVVAPQVRGVALSPTLDTLLPGATRRLTATVDADEGMGTTVSWSSSAPSVAAVAGDGLVTAVSVGTTQITARSVADTARKAIATVVVRPPEVRAITLPSQANLREREQRSLQATVTAEPGADQRLVWTSSETAVATISADGTLAAGRAGTTMIAVRSLAFPTVRAERSVTITSAAPFVAWSRQTVGVVGTLRAEGGPLSMVSRGASRTMITMIAYDWGFPYDTATYAMEGSTWSIVAGSGTSTPAIMGLTNHENDEVIGFGGAFVADRRVYRWNGAWQPLPRPAAGIFDGLGGPQSLPGGNIATKGRDGGFDQLLLWNGSTWSELRRWGRPANYQQGRLWMTTTTSGYLHQNFAGGYHIVRYDAPSTMTLLPRPANNGLFFAEYRGNDPNNLLAHGSGAESRIVRWNGTSWSSFENGWPADAFVWTFEICVGVPVVLTTDGRVFRLVANQFQQLGTDDDVLADDEARMISCAPDGTIRVASGSGAIARWSGTAWILETFTPRFTSVSAASSSLAWAGSTAGRIYRWSGGSWEESYRTRGLDAGGAIRSITSWADGRVVALRGTTTILRRDGGVWRVETGGELIGVNAVWGPNADLVFAVRTDGRIIRSVNGGAWQPVSPAGTALRAIDGLGPNHAIAIGSSLRTLRWNGETWTEVMPSVAGTFNADRLHVSAFNDAWVATSATAGQTASRIYRFDGSAWNAVDVTSVGGNDGTNGTTTLALFGTGPSNVYALRGIARGPRTLYRYNGSAWSTVTQLSTGFPDWVHLGSGVPGFALIAGSRGEVHSSSPPP